MLKLIKSLFKKSQNSTKGGITKETTPKIEITIPIPPPKKYITELTVYYNDGTYYGVDAPTPSSKRDITPYIHFYKWLFSKNSEFYDLNHSTGSHIIKRINIRYIELLLKRVI